MWDMDPLEPAGARTSVKMPSEAIPSIADFCQWVRPESEDPPAGLYVDEFSGESMAIGGRLTRNGVMAMLSEADKKWAVFIDGMSVAIRERLWSGSVGLACGEVLSERSWPGGRLFACLDTPALAVYDAILSERVESGQSQATHGHRPAAHCGG